MSDLAERLRDHRVVICAGPGGVGKTTISAAVGLGFALAGRRVAVVTVDPARRLAEALGLDALDNRPQPVDRALLKDAGIRLNGELSAMMLDVKRTFDELISHLSPDPRTAAEILANPVYQQLSTAIAGSQEYTGMAKLFELVEEGSYETIVLDTPPSRSATDFLQAPERLIRFLDDRALAALLRPSGLAFRTAGFVLSAIRRITGAALLEDLSTFFRLLGGILGGFRTRATEVQRLLTDPATGFLVLSSGEPAALDEAICFARELERAGMRRRGVIVNRVQPLDPNLGEIDGWRSGAVAPALAAKVARTHRELQLTARRDQASIERLQNALREPNLFSLVDREGAVQDLQALFEVQRELFG